jgi:superfamily I DNA/RNA helicase
VELLDSLSPINQFAVGDPRQSIYGWRGSRVDHILNFPVKYKASVLSLTTNYRSNSQIVHLINSVIKPMRMPDLVGGNSEADSVVLVTHETEENERRFVVQSILSLATSRREVFILARTNRQIDEMEKLLQESNMKYLKRTDEQSKEGIDPEHDQITISTVHAIKGLEAEVVYLIGANSLNFPIQAQDHPILEAVKADDSYDKYDEELRVFYVALSRAKKKLIINYTGVVTPFLKPGSLSIINTKIDLKNYDKWKYNKKDTSGDDFLMDEDLVY